MTTLPLTLETEGRSAERIITSAIATVREHFGMEISYLSEFVDGRSVMRAVDAPGLGDLLKVGDSRDLNDIYCQRIVDGELPELIPDTREVPGCMALPVTTDTPIGSHVSVPIRRQDGSVYGMFCCLSPRPNPSLTQRDLSVMRAFAGLAAEQVNGAIARRDALEGKLAELRGVTETRSLRMVYQPIVSIPAGAVRGYEALCRIASEPYRTPDVWFADAAAVGMGVDLELAAIEAALAPLARFPDGVYVSFNAGPETVASGRLSEVLEGRRLDRLVLELTEHDRIEADGPLLQELARWRARGLRVAIDDAGAGYSGLQQILKIAPEVLKLDRSLVCGIDADPARRALGAAMAHFAAETGATVIAEGIETADEARALAALGIPRGQGWHFGRPAPVEDVLGIAAGTDAGDRLVA